MARRMFYVDEVRGGKASLRGETAQHLRKVLRVETGQQFEISDGARIYLAAVEEFGKDLVEFRVMEEIAREPAPARVHLLVSLIKFDRFEWILEKATELGVERVTPVYAMRSEKGLDQAAAKRMERWRKIVHEAGQQSRRVAPPVVEAAAGLEEALRASAGIRWFLDEDGRARPLLEGLPATRSREDEIALLAGPEGGWDPREREAAEQAGWLRVSLGPQILRAETASIAALACTMSAWHAGR
jgi:16S rRNA (uracil1498-N3)-methyltransferase